VRLLAAPDKFRGTLSAVEAARAMAAGAAAAGWDAAELPLADGGEGTLDALGGANRTTVVSGPLGEAVEAGWRLDDGVAVVEMARASGLDLAGGRESNDPLDATTRGTGQLIAAALDGGASRVLVGVGGSAQSRCCGGTPRCRSRCAATCRRCSSTQPPSTGHRRERRRCRSKS
jgi:glycerate kinase